MVSSEDYRECLVKNLITIKDSIKEHNQLIESEKEIQREILDRLWVLANRYSILIKGVPTKLRLPFESVNSPDDEIKAEFLTKLGTLENSNFRLASSLSIVKNNNRALEQFLDEMEVEHLLALDKTSILQLSFASCIEMLDDFIKYYTRLQSEIDCFAHLLRPERVLSVERYKKLLKKNRDFSEYFSQSLALLHILKKTK